MSLQEYYYLIATSINLVTSNMSNNSNNKNNQTCSKQQHQVQTRMENQQQAVAGELGKWHRRSQ
jgi:hypothetical protein